MKDISQFIKECREEIIYLRRDFHSYPELGLAEHRTGKIVADYLTECGLEVCRLNSTGVVGLLRGEGKGPTLLMRADMDALPIQEENELAYSSTVDGVMHACGHDAHTAMLMVAAKYLCQKRSKLNGNIKFVFEPNEENVGALGMIEEGVLENPKVDACVGVHVWSPLESGKIGVKAGPVMAGMQHFKITITGKGGHTATPQSAIDPILVSAAVIQAVQTIQTRELDALNEPAVIMFGSIAGGSAANIIPDSVTLEGTIRYLFDGDDENENSPIARLKRIVKGVCETYRATHKIEFPFGHPTLVNDASFTSFFTSQVVGKMSPTLEVEPLVTLAGEDFSEFASRVPGLFYFLGAGKSGVENFPHHHPRFDIDEGILEIGVELHVRTALEYLTPVNGK
ncbi:MAG: amidohydrolase [Desulforhopalus sp.]